MQIKLWIFPKADFPAWKKLTGDTKLESYRDHRNMIAAIQADQERQGREVVRVGMRVASMESALAARNWESTPQNRAAIIAEEPAMKSSQEWLFEFGLFSDGQPITELECDELLVMIIDWASERGLLVGGGFRPGSTQ